MVRCPSHIIHDLRLGFRCSNPWFNFANKKRKRLDTRHSEMMIVPFIMHSRFVLWKKINAFFAICIPSFIIILNLILLLNCCFSASKLKLSKKNNTALLSRWNMTVDKCEILRSDHQCASYKCLVKTDEDENKSTWNSAEGLQESLNSVYGPGTKFLFVAIGRCIQV